MSYIKLLVYEIETIITPYNYAVQMKTENIDLDSNSHFVFVFLDALYRLMHEITYHELESVCEVSTAHPFI